MSVKAAILALIPKIFYFLLDKTINSKCFFWKKKRDLLQITLLKNRQKDSILFQNWNEGVVDESAKSSGEKRSDFSKTLWNLFSPFEYGFSV